jgi:uncharacterized protein YndB with AHSA1/START domain
MDGPDFVYVIFIEATPEAVWQGLTSPDFTEKYWGGLRIESTWDAGARVRTLRAGQTGWEGKVLEADPPRRLSYTFHMGISPAHQADPPSRVTFEIDQLGAMCRLTLRHHHEHPDSATQASTQHGWPAFMSSLKSLLETGRPLSFTGLGFGPSDAGREGTR